MKEIIYSILPNIINDAASGNRLLYITDEFNENIVSVAEATDMTVFCEDLDLLSKYRRLFKNCKGVIFARSKEELNKDYNGSLKVKEKHKQLVYVLDQIKSKVEF